jgi:hypothetical protein
VWSRRGRFIAYDDQGRGYEVRYSADNTLSEEMGGETAEGIELWTDSGGLVERIRKGEYRIVHTGVIIRSDSPKAP